MFLRTLFKSKIHRATITDSNLGYEGSITIDQTLMKAADLAPGELVHVLNINNGARFETYVMTGKPGNGDICLNGAAARLGECGDKVIIISYAQVPDNEVKDWTGCVVQVDDQNNVCDS